MMSSSRRTSKDAGQDLETSNPAKVSGGFLDSVLSFIGAPISFPSTSQANEIDTDIDPRRNDVSCSYDDRPFEFSGESSSRHNQLGIQSEETWLTIDDVKLLTQPSPAPAPSRKPPPPPSLKARCLDEDGSKEFEIKAPASAFASTSSTSAFKKLPKQIEAPKDSNFSFPSPSSLPSSIKPSTTQIEPPQDFTSDDANASDFSFSIVKTPAKEIQPRETPPWDLQFSTPVSLKPSPNTGSNDSRFVSARKYEDFTAVSMITTAEDWTSVLNAALNKPTPPTPSNSVVYKTSPRDSPEGPKNVAVTARKQNPPQHHPQAQTIQQQELDFSSAARATREAEIKRWAAGKDGNVRALLSSLHLILWPECGWKSVALTELISPAAVKKVYRAALLHVHPDKIQRAGATAEQKYIAESVFNLLNEAFKKFDTQELH